MTEPVQKTDEGNSSEDEVSPDKSSEDERNPDKSSEDEINQDKSSEDENNRDKSPEGDGNPDKSSENVKGLDIMDLFTETHSKITCANCCRTFDGMVEISKHFESCTADVNTASKENTAAAANDFPGWSESESEPDFGLPKIEPAPVQKVEVKKIKSIKCEFCNSFMYEDAMVNHLLRHTREPRHKNDAMSKVLNAKSTSTSELHTEKRVRMTCEFCNLYLAEDMMFRHILRHTIEPRHLASDVDETVIKMFKNLLNPRPSTHHIKSKNREASRVSSNNTQKSKKSSPKKNSSGKSEGVDTFADCIAEIREDDSNDGNDHAEGDRGSTKGEESDRGQSKKTSKDPKDNEKSAKESARLCEVCGKEFRNLASHLKSHKNAVEKKKDYVCKVCDKPFKNALGLKAHGDVHIEARNYGCRPCSKFFKSRRALKKHLLTHTRTKRYFCTICSKVFSNQHNRDRHMDIHNAVRKHVCNLCQKSFTQLKSLQDHLDAHEGRVRYFCSCGKGFTHNGALLTHKYQAHGKGYKYIVKCKTCGKKFRTDEGLYDHSKQPCKDKRRYFCATCGSIFNKECAALSHQKSTNSRVHVCNLCSKAYEKRICLNQHVNLKHKGKKPAVIRKPAGFKRTPAMKAKIAAIVKRGKKKTVAASPESVPNTISTPEWPKNAAVNQEWVRNVAMNQDWAKNVAMNQEWAKNVAMNQEWAKNMGMNHEGVRNTVVPPLNQACAMSSVPVNHDWMKHLAMNQDGSNHAVMQGMNYANAMNVHGNHDWGKNMAMNHDVAKNMSMGHDGVRNMSMNHELVKNMSMNHEGVRNMSMHHEGVRNMSMDQDVIKNMPVNHGAVKNMVMNHEVPKNIAMNHEKVKPERAKKAAPKNRGEGTSKVPVIDEAARNEAMNHEAVRKAVMKSMAFNQDSAKIAAMHHGDMKNVAVIKVGPKTSPPKKNDEKGKKSDDKKEGRLTIKTSPKDEKEVHKCHICFKRYTRKRMFDRHLLFHSGVVTKRERRKKDKNADKTAAAPVSEGEDTKYRFKCDLCPKAYTQQHVLERHLVTHSGIRPFSCTICEKSFFQKTHLDAHMRLHVAEKEFSCHICSSQFRHKGNLTVHLKKLHGFPPDGNTPNKPGDDKTTHNVEDAAIHYEKAMANHQQDIDDALMIDESARPVYKKSRRKAQTTPKKTDKRSNDYFRLISFMKYNLMGPSSAAQPQMQHEWNY